MATYTNNSGVLECSGTDITSAGIYSALISEGIGSGHSEDTNGNIDAYVLNGPLRIMTGGVWDFSNQTVKISANIFETYGDVFAGSESGGTTSGGSTFIYIGATADTFRVYDNASFKMFGGAIYATHRIRADNNVEFWLIDCDSQLLDSVSVDEGGSFGSGQDIKYDRSRVHDSSGVGVKLYAAAAADFSLAQTKVQNCEYAFQMGDPAFVSPVLTDVEIDSCNFHIVGNKGDIDATFINPDFSAYRPSTIGLSAADIVRESFRYELNVLDSTNTAIEGASVIIRDQAGTIQSNDTTDASGNVSDLPTFDGTTVLFRATNAGATRTVRAETTRSVCKYGHLIRQDVFSATNDFVDNVNLIIDPQVSLSEAAASALTEVSNASEAIAAVSLFVQDNYSEESLLPVFIDDGALNGRDNDVVFDAAAAQIVAYSGGTLTLKSTTYVGLVKTTGEVSTANGAVQNGGIIDVNGDSFLTFESIDSWIVYASAANRDGNTSSIGSGTSSESFRFTFSGGTTYYMRLTAGTDVIFKDVTPIAAGETVVSLGTSALLVNINASIQESSELAEYSGRVTVDLIDGTNSTEYPYGTLKTPTSTIANALVIADEIGVKTIQVQGATTALSEELNGYRIIAGVSDSTGSRILPEVELSVLNGAENCFFDGFQITGLTDVTSPVLGNIYQNCYVDGLAGASGVIRDSKLGGDIQVEYALDIQGSYGTVDFVVSGAAARLTVPNFSGSMTISGMTSAGAVASIGVIAGVVTITSSCSSGTIIIANADQVIDNSTGTSVTVLQDSGGSGATPQEIWEYNISGITTDGLAGKELLDASGAGSGADVNIISVNGVSVTDINEFKADTSLLATTAQLNTLESHGDTTWSTATGFSTLSAGDVQTELVTYGANKIAPDNAAIAAIPTNPLLTTDVRLDNIDTTISSRLSSVGYTPPPSVVDIDTAITLSHGAGSYQTATGFSTFDPDNDVVANVALVDVVTQNTDMRGTDGANTVEPDNVTILSISSNVELIRKYHDNDTVFLSSDLSTKTTQALAYYTVVYDDDGVTPLKTVMFTNSLGAPTLLPNATGYEKL